MTVENNNIHQTYEKLLGLYTELDAQLDVTQVNMLKAESDNDSRELAFNSVYTSPLVTELRSIADSFGVKFSLPELNCNYFLLAYIREDKTAGVIPIAQFKYGSIFNRVSVIPRNNFSTAVLNFLEYCLTEKNK